MVTQEDINTVLGAACYNLGYPVINAALYRDIVPPEITDEQLKAECEKIKAEQDIFSSGQGTQKLHREVKGGRVSGKYSILSII